MEHLLFVIYVYDLNKNCELNKNSLTKKFADDMNIEGIVHFFGNRGELEY